MIEFREITTTDCAYNYIEELLHSSFPEAERREDWAQRYNTLHERAFHTLLIKNDDAPAGIFTYWDFDTFIYGEHFAIEPGKRNGGLGARVLKAFLTFTGKPLVLEVEPADLSPLASRRIEFYRRSGLRLWSTPYMQPPYRQGGESIPLCLMSTDGLDETTDFEMVKRIIHQRVYGVTNPL